MLKKKHICEAKRFVLAEWCVSEKTSPPPESEIVHRSLLPGLPKKETCGNPKLERVVMDTHHRPGRLEHSASSGLFRHDHFVP